MAKTQIITFEVDGTEYGTDINYINGIIKIKNQKIFSIPEPPPSMEGLINLRGKVYPVFNLRKKFGCSNTAVLSDAKLVIVKVDKGEVAFIVDDVTDIFRMDDSDIEKSSGFLNTGKSNYILGFGKFDSKLVVILDLNRFFDSDEIFTLDKSLLETK